MYNVTLVKTHWHCGEGLLPKSAIFSLQNLQLLQHLLFLLQHVHVHVYIYSPVYSTYTCTLYTHYTWKCLKWHHIMHYCEYSWWRDNVQCTHVVLNLLHLDFAESVIVSESGQLSPLLLHCRGLLWTGREATCIYMYTCIVDGALFVYLIHCLHFFSHQFSHLLSIRLKEERENRLYVHCVALLCLFVWPCLLLSFFLLIPHLKTCTCGY